MGVSYVDLIKTMSLMRYEALSGVNIVCKLGNAVDIHPDRAEKMDNLVWVEAELHCCKFPLDKMMVNVSNDAFKVFVQRMRDVHFLAGKIYVLVEPKYINSGFKSVSGRISRVRGTQCSFYIARWTKVNNIFKLEQVGVYEPSKTVYGEAYDWVYKSIKSGELCQTARPKSLQITGVEIPYPIRMTVKDADRYIHNGDFLNSSVEQTMLDAQGTSVMQQQMNSQQQPQEPIVPIAPIVPSSEPNVNSVVSNSAVGVQGVLQQQAQRGTDGRFLPISTPLDIIRYEIEKKSAYYDVVSSALCGGKDRIGKILEDYKEDRGYVQANIVTLANLLRQYWNRKPMANMGHTGKMLFVGAFTKCVKMWSKSEEKDRASKIESMFNVFPGTDAVDAWETGDLGTLSTFEVAKDLVRLRVEIFFALYEGILGLRCSLASMHHSAMISGYSLMDVMVTNPYHLCYFNSRISMLDMDKIAMAMGYFFRADYQMSRDVAYMHLVLTDENSDELQGSTIMSKSECMRKIKLGYLLAKRDYSRMVENVMDGRGIYLTKDAYADIMTYFEDMKDVYVSLPVINWQENGTKMLLRSNNTMVDVYQAYIDSGLGIESVVNGVRYIADYQVVKKEMYIYDKVYRMSDGGTSVSRDEIDNMIDGFESRKTRELGLSEPFKLEERQREAVHLVGTPVFAVIGGAGCGKTTTAEAIVDVLMEVYGFDEEEVKFVAPTGKAANRLKESIKRNTQTIHSLCNIFGSRSFVLDTVEGSGKSKAVRAIVVDESSMINLDVAYEFFSFVREDTVIIFLGDTGQLPPIGFGRVFADLLKFIPCMTLNVSKRASDKSGVTRNANEILRNSDGVVSALSSSNDFKLINTDEEEVPNMISSLIKYHLGRADTLYDRIDNKVFGGVLTPDDIQIVTPIRKDKYKWGSDVLNPLVQGIVNPLTVGKRAVRYNYTATGYYEYREGDRVIHLQNDREMKRYRLEDKAYVALESTGVMNGDVGKLKRIHLSGVSTEDEDLLGMMGSDIALLEVEYSDPGIETEDGVSTFSVFYTALLLTDSKEQPVMIDGCHRVIGGTLKNISLAYALTVHKMQGSQSKLIIIPFFRVSRDGFLSRNMIYTAVTRAVKGCYVVGDVDGEGNAIERARRLEVVSKRNTLMDKIVQ